MHRRRRSPSMRTPPMPISPPRLVVVVVPRWLPSPRAARLVAPPARRHTSPAPAATSHARRPAAPAAPIGPNHPHLFVDAADFVPPEAYSIEDQAFADQEVEEIYIDEDEEEA
ncbi:hypothetical protein GUJ93_ZPchr0002g22945 [Zizania palustris]|uniref:Uncharacterized protein n=1 Tax=Zizania palustris TaxID=103762 RepID=A0A8J5VUT8_ZIZPA|nr:hypothetical protein GUJ93_ZPchr0002g22945 [Zizania palustris]